MPKGQWEPPDAGGAPQEVKDILKTVYSAYRDKHPAENEATKARGAKIAWGAVHKAGWSKDKDGKWIKRSNTKESIINETIAEIEKEPDMKESLANSFDEIRDKVRLAIEAMPTFKKQVNGVDMYVYIRDISPNKVIVKYGDTLFAMSYSIVDDVVVIGTPEKVVERYIKESIEITKEGNLEDLNISDFVSLKESKYDSDKSELEVILIEAGTNEEKKRHYPVSTVMEAAPNFRGLKMYMNHPTKTEEKERPERKLQDWVSTITESYGIDGKAIGKVAVHDMWLRERLKDPIFRENVGLSINMGGKLSVGKVNGKEMQIVEAISPRRKDGLVGSVDWVTEAGARGRVSRLLESRTKEDFKVEKLLENATVVDLKETRKDLVESIVKEAVAPKDTEIAKLNANLKEANDKIAKFENEGKLKAQKDAVETQLKESKAPDAVKDRVREAFSTAIVEGDLKEAITKRLAKELEYASKISGKGKIALGGTGEGDIKESIQNDLDKRAGVVKKEEGQK